MSRRLIAALAAAVLPVLFPLRCLAAAPVFETNFGYATIYTLLADGCGKLERRLAQASLEMSKRGFATRSADDREAYERDFAKAKVLAQQMLSGDKTEACAMLRPDILDSVRNRAEEAIQLLQPARPQGLGYLTEARVKQVGFGAGAVVCGLRSSAWQKSLHAKAVAALSLVIGEPGAYRRPTSEERDQAIRMLERHERGEIESAQTLGQTYCKLFATMSMMPALDDLEDGAVPLIETYGEPVR